MENRALQLKLAKSKKSCQKTAKRLRSEEEAHHGKHLLYNQSRESNYRLAHELVETQRRLDEHMCGMCYERERDIMYTSCGHVFNCSKCYDIRVGMGTSECPICRSHSGVRKIHWS